MIEKSKCSRLNKARAQNYKFMASSLRYFFPHGQDFLPSLNFQDKNVQKNTLQPLNELLSVESDNHLKTGCNTIDILRRGRGELLKT